MCSRVLCTLSSLLHAVGNLLLLLLDRARVTSRILISLCVHDCDFSRFLTLCRADCYACTGLSLPSVEEAGGKVTDAGGAPLNWAGGRYLETLDRGIVATSKVLHDRLMDAIKESWSSSQL